MKDFIRKLFTNKKTLKQHALWEELYGEFDKSNYDKYKLTNLPSESEYYHGELIKWAVDVKPESVLFVGENLKTAAILNEKIKAEEIYTTGLSGTDYNWNFEEDIPEEINRKFDLVVSQAIFEHLLNPYKHLQDLSMLLNNGGHILIHTVMPGFRYHRYPIDSIRFFPDWFEEVGKRFKLKIAKKRLKDTHIFYMYQKV